MRKALPTAEALWRLRRIGASIFPVGSVTVDGGTSISYAAVGSGPAIVLHPGLSFSGAVFPLCIVDPLVRAGHTVIAIDPRDTGRSSRYAGPAVDLMRVVGGDIAAAPYTIADMASDALAVLDSLGIDSAVFVGHSMGGSVVAAIQAMAPQRVAGLVLFSSAPGFGAGPTPEQLELFIRDVPKGRAGAIGWLMDLSRWAMRSHWDEVTGHATAELLVDEHGWWGVPVTHLTAGIAGTPGIAPMAPDEESTLIVFGDEDDQAQAIRRLAASLRGAAVVEIEGCGHWFPEPGPWQQIAEAILRVADA